MMNDRDFKGVWIPREVWLDERLTALDKVILTEIDSLDRGDDHCFKSNENLAAFCQCSVTKVSNAVSKLIDLGYVKVASFDGRTRRLQSCLTFSARQPYKKCKADLQKVQASNTISNSFRKNTPYSSCAEPSKDASTPSVYTLPLNDGTLHEITKEDYEKYKRLYPSVDVMGEFRKMEGWFDGHQSKLKTRQGIRRFINTWLSKEQDKGNNQRPSVAEKPAAPVDEKPAPPPYTDRSNWWNGMTFQQFMDGRRFFQRDGKWYRLTPDGYTEERGADFAPTCDFVRERTIKYDKPLNPKPVLQD